MPPYENYVQPPLTDELLDATEQRLGVRLPESLVDLGQSVQGVNAGRITFVTIPTTGYADEWGNEQPRMDDVRA
ncbi:hypothetical protein PXH80_33805, partial [Mycolicibacterium smegmatis]|uniref:hypothetical protein n=1 Tax=Mycolicibacterium smegmatis TaxID=1772 RepID=UPI0023DAE07B